MVVENYLTELAMTEHEEPVLVGMEARAAEHGFPIVGRATGRFLELAARAVGARRVMELGSGYGYSAYWFAQAVGPDGEVVCTDGDPANAGLAKEYLNRVGVWDRVRYRVGDAVSEFAKEAGDFDVVYATSTRTVTRTAGARRATASALVACGCVTTRFGAGASQPKATRRTARPPSFRSTTGWLLKTPGNGGQHRADSRRRHDGLADRVTISQRARQQACHDRRRASETEVAASRWSPSYAASL